MARVRLMWIILSALALGTWPFGCSSDSGGSGSEDAIHETEGGDAGADVTADAPADGKADVAAEATADSDSSEPEPNRITCTCKDAIVVHLCTAAPCSVQVSACMDACSDHEMPSTSHCDEDHLDCK